ncbi:MAG: TerC family protein [Betaproteobacteria bacterium]|jgi:YjbE family integral membrane protein|nr:TerC family protein [Betaproteobacteria bacterium]
MVDLASPDFWLALGKIIWVNILLSGDNAVVIALAARSLPPQQQKKAIMIGSGAAIALRIVLTLVAAQLLLLPYLKLIGALLLLYIGVTLLLPEDESDDGGSGVTSSMATAVRTILIADLVMSLDNVIAVAAAANGNVPLLIIGLATSIPLVIFGSTLLLKVIERFPAIVWAGAALLGFIAGEISVTDPAVVGWFAEQEAALGLGGHRLQVLAGAVGAALVLGVGKVLLSRRASLADSTPV